MKELEERTNYFFLRLRRGNDEGREPGLGLVGVVGEAAAGHAQDLGVAGVDHQVVA